MGDMCNAGDLQFQIGDYLFDLRYEFVLDLMRAASCFGVDDGYTGKGKSRLRA